MSKQRERRMKYVVAGIATLVALAVSSTADAADSSARPPAPAVPSFRWSGFYIGANLGYTWTDPKSFPLTATQSVPPLGGVGPLTFQANGIYPLASDIGQSGAIGGLQAGYNWQVASWVTGIETEFDLASSKRMWRTSACCSSPGTLGASTVIMRRLDALSTLRARLGFTVDRTLYYVTGGLAVSESTLSYAAAASNILGSLGSPFNASTVWQAGWTLGGGVEFAPVEHWSLKAEYLYYDLGSQSTTIASRVPAIPSES
jgi:outer membrane immunogenic protein